MRNHPKLGMQIPPLDRLGVDTGGLDALVEKVAKFEAELRNVEGRIRGGEAELAEARALDDEAYASALKAGKTPPAQEHVREAEEKLEELGRRSRALAKVVADLVEETRRHVLRNAPEWKARVIEALSAATERYEKAVEELVAGRTDFYATWSAVLWMDDPLGKYAPRGGETPVILGLEKGPGFGQREPVYLGPVLEALRYEAQGPEREREKAAQPVVEMHRDQPQSPVEREAG